MRKSHVCSSDTKQDEMDTSDLDVVLQDIGKMLDNGPFVVKKFNRAQKGKLWKEKKILKRIKNMFVTKVTKVQKNQSHNKQILNEDVFSLKPKHVESLGKKGPRRRSIISQPSSKGLK